MGTQPIKILCITGWCRNGSTIIGNILNEIPGFMHVGELHFLWKNSAGLGANKWCGCGAALTDCPFWVAILALGRPAGLTAEEYAGEVIRRQLACVRTRHTWRVLRRGLDRDEIREHARLMTRTYHAIAERSGASVIVNTTKFPGEAGCCGYAASPWPPARSGTGRSNSEAITRLPVIRIASAPGVTVIWDADDSWRTGLVARSRLAVVALAWPQFRRYGYRFSGQPVSLAPGPGPEREVREGTRGTRA